MTNKTIAKFFVLTAGILTLPVASYAGKELKEAKEIVEKCKESCITGDIGVNVVSQYVSRGYIFENQGGIIQPYADLYFKLYEGEGFLNKVSLNLGIWNSFQSYKTDAGLYTGTHVTTTRTVKKDKIDGVRTIDEGVSTQRASSTRGWYEFDFTAGVSFTFAKNFTFTPSYYTFLSPNDGFASFQGLNLKLAYDTTDLIGFNLAPYAQVLFELENKAGGLGDEGIYYELGIAPSVPVGPITLSFPITVGFGSNDFYVSPNVRTNSVTVDDPDLGQIETQETTTRFENNETFGFLSGGVVASYNLPFIPECYGTWTVTAGYTYYYLGRGLDYYNSDRVGGTVRDENEHEHVFSGGLMVAF